MSQKYVEVLAAIKPSLSCTPRVTAVGRVKKELN